MDTAYYIFYQSAMVLSLLASAFVGVLAWQRRQIPGAREMLVLSVATFIWTLGYLCEANSNTLERQLLFTGIGYIGSMAVPVAWFLFALHYTTDNRVLTGWSIAPLCIVPLVAVILVWTNSWHHLMWSGEHLAESGLFMVTVKNYGTVFWLIFAYNYLLIITGAIILVRRLFTGPPLYRGQAISLILAVALPLIWNIIYVFDLIPALHKDLTPVMFAISWILVILGLMRFQLLASVPFTHKFLIQHLRDGIMAFDMDNRMLDANPAALAIFGLGKQAIGKKIADLLPLLPGIRPPDSESASTELILTVSREERTYELETILMHNNHSSKIGWLAILHDITERKKVQERLMAQDRLTSIGELTAGVAHELNNPLTGIIGFSQLLHDKDLPADIKDDLETIGREARRAARIVNNLITFSSKQHDGQSLTDINEIIEKTLMLRENEQEMHNIRTITHLASGLPEIQGNALQLQQVFLNIIINAEFFMLEAHQKGILTIVTEQIGDSIRITFSDDGPGISAENMKRIFNPFFTTKDVGQGTGLGLSICHGIINEHGGRIRVESTPGQGATFIVELPVYKKTD